MKSLINSIFLFCCITGYSQGKSVYSKLDTTISIPSIILNESSLSDKDSLLKLYTSHLQPSLKHVNKKRGEDWYISGKDDLSNRAIIIIRHGMIFNSSYSRSAQSRLNKDLKQVKTSITNDLTKLKANSIEDLEAILQTFTNIQEKAKSLNDNDFIKKIDEMSMMVAHKSDLKYDTKTNDLDTKLLALNEMFDKYDNISTQIHTFGHLEELDTVKVTMLHTEKINGDYKWSDQLNHTKNILLIFVDGKGDLIKSEIEIEKLESSFAKEFKDLIKLFKATQNLGTGEDKKFTNPEFQYRFVELRRWNVRPPSNLFLYSSDTVKFEIFEKSHFSIRAGLNAAQIEAQNFKIDNGMLTVSLDSAGKELWKEHLFVGFGFHPWGRGPKYDPRLFNYQKGSGALPRIGIWGGFNLSLKPLDNLYIGLSYDLGKNFILNGGVTWNNLYESKSIDIGDITSLPDALKFSDKRYGAGKLFMGLSFSPSQVIKTLDLGKDDETEETN